jgi:hypothetical protein
MLGHDKLEVRHHGAPWLPVRLIQNNNFMPSRRQGHFLLSKGFDLISDNIDTPSIRNELIRKYNWRPAHLSSDAFNSSTPSLYASPSSWCARQWMLVVFPMPGIPFRRLRSYLKKECRKHAHGDNKVRHIAILCYDFKPRNGVAVSYDVIEYMWTVFLNPSPY